jgi:signal transduction histidine kinase
MSAAWPTLRPRSAAARIALVAAGGGILGALTALVAGAASGMSGAELDHLAALFGVGVLVTAVAVTIADRLLARATIRRRLFGVALASALAGLANLAALAALMLVDGHDAVLIAILLVYSLGVGAGTALALARPSARALEDAVESQRRDLLTAVSHDLRTPLASLRAMIEAIDDGVVEDPATLRLYTAEMRRSAGALGDLVDDLFELIQLESPAIEAENSATLDEVLGAALAACGSSAAEKGLHLETHLDGASEAPCSPRLGRVIQNLLQNAIRHTPVDGTVRVEARRAAGGLQLSVENEGDGIPPESLPLVFDPFWRGDSARSGDGSGLGLTLAKRIVESLDGRIEVESEPDRGARFAVVVPDRG